MPELVPNTWLLDFLRNKAPFNDDQKYDKEELNGLPWGCGTAMATRYKNGKKPWDEGCKVTPLIGGYETMEEIKKAFETVIKYAESLPPNTPPDQKGYVYIAGWRLNAFRDMFYKGDPSKKTPPEWEYPTYMNEEKDYQNPFKILRSLIYAGVQVRVLLWYPAFASHMVGFKAHREDHLNLAQEVQSWNLSTYTKLYTPYPVAGIDPIGVLGLDLRLEDLTGSHHQKLIIIRNNAINVAFCGGVDLAYTRRDAPDSTNLYDPVIPKFLGGDWQSGDNISDLSPAGREIKQGADLPINVYGNTGQIWHDQHLKLEGPIVATLEENFRERWIDSGRFFSLEKDMAVRGKQVIFSAKEAIDEASKTVKPLKNVTSVGPAGDSIIQMWRTIPLRKRKGDLFKLGEFTAMSGISNVCKKSRQLIWIFDQYFWSRPLARLLNKQLKENPTLHVIIILPPFADADKVRVAQHRARKVALNDLVADPSNSGVADRVAVYNLWHPVKKMGIYCHAKTQMYDDSLLVCGSVNLNRRSFTSDTELACAVLDTNVVRKHRKRLWKLLFPNVRWIEDELALTLDFNSENGDAGKTFFDYFNIAASWPNSYVIKDGWRCKYGKPIVLQTPDKGVERYQDNIEDDPDLDVLLQTEASGGIAAQIAIDHSIYDTLLDPSSIDPAIESGCNSLDVIVEKLEKPAENGKFRWRKP